MEHRLICLGYRVRRRRAKTGVSEVSTSVSKLRIQFFAAPQAARPGRRATRGIRQLPQFNRGSRLFLAIDPDQSSLVLSWSYGLCGRQVLSAP